MRFKMLLTLLIVCLPLITVTAQKRAESAEQNTLTEAEKKAGWRLLFDGKSLEGWRGFHKKNVPLGWAVEDGCIKKVPGTGELGQAGGDMITNGQFDNFEFSIEWKLSPGGNSGIKYLVSESLPPKGKSGISFEMQVLDDARHPDAKMGIAGNRTSGALYDLIAPSKGKILKPVGEFNQSSIVVKGNHIEHWLNGVKVVEFERGSDEFKALIAKSKFKDTKGFGEFARGHILLQDHGDAVWYRNIKIRSLN